MNFIEAKIKNIFTKENLNIMEVGFAGEILYMLSLELPSLKKDDMVTLCIKPIHVVISRDFHVDTSFLNQLKVSVIAIETGELLTSIHGVINGVILESVITTKAFYRLDIHVGDSVIMLLPEGELFLV